MMDSRLRVVPADMRREEYVYMAVLTALPVLFVCASIEAIFFKEHIAFASLDTFLGAAQVLMFFCVGWAMVLSTKMAFSIAWYLSPVQERRMFLHAVSQLQEPRYPAFLRQLRLLRLR